jgi:hypothetical protein
MNATSGAISFARSPTLGIRRPFVGGLIDGSASKRAR